MTRRDEQDARETDKRRMGNLRSMFRGFLNDEISQRSMDVLDDYHRGGLS